MALAKTGARLRVAVPCFLLRASSRPCKRQTAAPAPPRLFLPQAAPRLRSQRQLPVSSTGCGRCRCLRRGTIQTQRIHSALPRPAAEICGQVFHKDFLFCGKSEALLKKAHPSPFSYTSDTPKADGLSDTQSPSNKISPPPKERGNFSVIGAAMRGYSKTDGTAFLQDRPDLAKRGNQGIPTLCIGPGRRSGLPLPKFSAPDAVRLKIWTAVLLRLANFPGGRQCALVKIGALRQAQLPVSSTGRGRCVCIPRRRRKRRERAGA